MRATYSEKLKDPRWQKLRLEVFSRDGWKCLSCGSTERTLHVHHLVYGKGEPWDVPVETLETLCEGCHDFRESFNDIFEGRSLIPTKLCMGFFYGYKRIFDGTIEDSNVRCKNILDLYRELFFNVRGRASVAGAQAAIADGLDEASEI